MLLKKKKKSNSCSVVGYIFLSCRMLSCIHCEVLLIVYNSKWRLLFIGYFTNKVEIAQHGSTLLLSLELMFHLCWFKCWIYMQVLEKVQVVTPQEMNFLCFSFNGCSLTSILIVGNMHSFSVLLTNGIRTMIYLVFFLYAAKPKCIPGLNFVRMLGGMS